jgi:hypothetical protein
VDGRGDDWIFKVDDAGEMVWQYVSHADGRDRFWDAIVAADGTIYAAGRDWTLGDAILLKLDSEGNEVWEILYDSPPGTADQYLFTEVVEFDDQIYVAARRRTPNNSALPGSWLHRVDPATGAVSDPIVAPMPNGAARSEIMEMDVTAAGYLLIAGWAEPTDSDGGEGGVYWQLVDANLSVVAEWNNMGQWRHHNFADAIELSDGRIAVTGQSDLESLDIAVANADGTDDRSLITDEFDLLPGNLIADEHGGFIAVLSDPVRPHPPTVVWVDSTLHIVRSEPLVDDLDVRQTRGAFIENPDNTFTLLFHEFEHDTNGNMDILLIKKAFD